MSSDYYDAIKVQRTHLYDQIANQLEELIITNKLQPHSRLPSERELAEWLGVGRPTIREATRVLQDRGLVELKPGSGTYVREVSNGAISQSIERFFAGNQSPVLELEEIREIMEPELAALAAERATPQNIERMEQALAYIEVDPNDLDRYIQGDAEFHIALVEAAQNKMLSAIYAPMIAMMKDAIREVTHHMVQAGKHDPQRHREILETIKAGQPEEARRALYEHLKGFREASALMREPDEMTHR
jgi:GntR family transcriptional repressor for pyruvate dehydrogenase complex